MPSGRGWDIDSDTCAVDDEDVPEYIAKQLPGIAWLVELHLAPQSAPASGISKIQSVAKSIARQFHGIIEDPQNDEIWLPSGVKRFVAPRAATTFDALEMSWWVADNSLRDAQGLNRLVDVMKRTLPEAIPRRYGEYEPPQFKLEVHGEQHFRDFLVNETLMGVYRCTRPVIELSISNSDAPGVDSRGGGYKANRFSVTIEASALQQPGWDKQLRAFWENVSLVLRPLFGDVRILRGFTRHGGSIYPGERHPVLSWWWRGIPNTHALAIVLGPPYETLWAGARDLGRHRDGLIFLDSGDWPDFRTVRSSVGDAPPALAQPEPAPADIGKVGQYIRHAGYPPLFPFPIGAAPQLG